MVFAQAAAFDQVLLAVQRAFFGFFHDKPVDETVVAEIELGVAPDREAQAAECLFVDHCLSQFPDCRVVVFQKV
jgi:hypothetical protein